MKEKTIIDFHTHIFPERIRSKTIESLSVAGNIINRSDGSAKGLNESMRKAGINLSINLPVMTRPDQVEKVNSSLIEAGESLIEHGIISFGGMHPFYDGYRSEIRRLRDAGIKGVKLHPAYQQTDIDAPEYKQIIDALSTEGMVCIIHCGLDIGIPGHDYADPYMLAGLIREIKPERLVLAHMGGWQRWRECEEQLADLPVLFDTAFSLGAITPRKGGHVAGGFTRNMNRDEFVTLVRRYGADKVVFGSDSPWADQMEYVRFIRESGLSESETELVLYKNASRILNLKS